MENNPARSVSNREWHNSVAQNKLQTGASGMFDASAESYKFRANANVFFVVFESELYKQRIIIYMSVSANGQRRPIRQLLQILEWLLAWGWALLTIIGGLGLILTLGPWPPTNGWFALFSGLVACPMTAWSLRRYCGINLPGWARFVIAFAIILLGRLALTIEGRDTFLPNFH